MVSKATITARDGAILTGELHLPNAAAGVILFAHDAGIGGQSHRNKHVAEALRRDGLGTLMIDFPMREPPNTRRPVGDTRTYADYLVAATRWLGENPATRHCRVGYFGARAGGAAALVAASKLGPRITAVVARGAPLDSIADVLPMVKSPTLLVVGGHDTLLVCINNEALASLRCEKQMRLVCGATRLFEEPQALERLAQLTCAWFARHLGNSSGYLPPAQRWNPEVLIP
jgi:putative phosphoribosyl transferase